MTGIIAVFAPAADTVMQYRQFIETLSPEVYERLKRAVEIGKWPDGRALTQEQRAQTLQAVIAWGELHLPPHERVGYIDPGPKAGGTCGTPLEQPLTWLHRGDGDA